MVEKEDVMTVQSHTEYTRSRTVCPRCGSHVPTRDVGDSCRSCRNPTGS